LILSWFLSFFYVFCRVDFIPWLVCDHARAKMTYVYTLKNKFKKGGNRFCTMMYHVVKSIKTSGGPATEARTLTFIGDNYGENKNNTNLAFAHDLIKHGWYVTLNFQF